MTARAAPERAPTHRTLAAIIGIAVATVVASAWFLLRPGRPLHVVEACWEGYRAARTAADTAAVDGRRVRVTPTVPEHARGHAHAPYTCGIWRESGAGTLVPPPQ